MVASLHRQPRDSRLFSSSSVFHDGLSFDATVGFVVDPPEPVRSRYVALGLGGVGGLHDNNHHTAPCNLRIALVLPMIASTNCSYNDNATQS